MIGFWISLIVLKSARFFSGSGHSDLKEASKLQALDVFKNDALKYCAARVAGHSGDVRKAWTHGVVENWKLWNPIGWTCYARLRHVIAFWNRDCSNINLPRPFSFLLASKRFERSHFRRNPYGGVLKSKFVNLSIQSHSVGMFWGSLGISTHFQKSQCDASLPQALGRQALQLCRRALELCCERTSSNTKLQATWQRSKNGACFPDPLYLNLPLVHKNVYHFFSARFQKMCPFKGLKKKGVRSSVALHSNQPDSFSIGSIGHFCHALMHVQHAKYDLEQPRLTTWVASQHM